MSFHHLLKRRLSLKKLKQNEDGVYSIEFAMVIIPTLLLVFAIIEFGVLFIANNLLDLGTQKASRLVRTGNAPTVAEFRDEVIKTAGVLLDPKKITIDVKSYDDFDEFTSKKTPAGPDASGNLPTGYDPGIRESIVLVRVYYIYEGMAPGFVPSGSGTSDGKRLLTSSTVFRNEPF